MKRTIHLLTLLLSVALWPGASSASQVCEQSGQFAVEVVKVRNSGASRQLVKEVACQEAANAQICVLFRNIIDYVYANPVNGREARSLIIRACEESGL